MSHFLRKKYTSEKWCSFRWWHFLEAIQMRSINYPTLRVKGNMCLHPEREVICCISQHVSIIYSVKGISIQPVFPLLIVGGMPDYSTTLTYGQILAILPFKYPEAVHFFCYPHCVCSSEDCHHLLLGHLHNPPTLPPLFMSPLNLLRTEGRVTFCSHYFTD